MKQSVIAAALLFVAGCSTGPVSFTGLSPDVSDALYACALRQVNQMGYTVTNTDRDAGFITGEKQTSGLGTALLTGQQYHDLLTVSVFDGSDGKRTMRVTAGQTQQSAVGFGAASRTQVAPKDSGKRDAMSILTACAPEGAAQQTAALMNSATMTAE
jgi:hypothetical protein